jgi:cyclase
MEKGKSPFGPRGMFRSASNLIFGNASNLRNNPTDAERTLWYLLKGNALGVKFRRQHPIGRFILDFYCHSERLAIEVDGHYHQLPEAQIQDFEKENFLQMEGIRVLRFSNKQVIQNAHWVIEKIRDQLLSAKP